MSTEKQILDAVKHGVSMEHKVQVNPYFEHGSIWCDHIKEDVAETMESLIAHETGCAVYKNKLKATDTEPWDQYVFDITSQEEEQDYEDNMSDAEADADTLASAGMGTDEDYGYYGDGEW